MQLDAQLKTAERVSGPLECASAGGPPVFLPGQASVRLVAMLSLRTHTQRLVCHALCYVMVVPHRQEVCTTWKCVPPTH